MARNIAFLGDQEWPRACFDFELAMDSATTALCVIDMQNYCIDPQGDLAYRLKAENPRLFEAYAQRVARVIAGIEQLLSAFRSQGRRIIFTRNAVFLPDAGDLIERRRRRERNCLKASEGRAGHLPGIGTTGHEILARLKPQPGEFVLDKNTASAFNSTALDLFLRNMKVETLVLAGLVTDGCVLLTAMDAADRGFNTIIAADASTTIDPGSHEASLLLFQRFFGYVMETGVIEEFIVRGP